MKCFDKVNWVSIVYFRPAQQKVSGPQQPAKPFIPALENFILEMEKTVCKVFKSAWTNTAEKIYLLSQNKC